MECQGCGQLVATQEHYCSVCMKRLNWGDPQLPMTGLMKPLGRRMDRLFTGQPNAWLVCYGLVGSLAVLGLILVIASN